MKKFLVPFVIIVAVVCLHADPEITFREEKINFGEINSGHVIDITFNFENTGNEMLVIKNINATCGCTYTRLEKKEYKPGEKGIIPVKFFSKGFQGRVVKTVTVSSNDKKSPYKRLVIEGVVMVKDFSVAEIENDLLDFGELKLNEKNEKQVVIKNTGNIELRILEITHSPEISTIFEKKSIKPGETGNLTVSFNPLQTGEFSTFLRIRTNAYKSPLLILRIKTLIVEPEK